VAAAGSVRERWVQEDEVVRDGDGRRARPENDAGDSAHQIEEVHHHVRLLRRPVDASPPRTKPGSRRAASAAEAVKETPRPARSGTWVGASNVSTGAPMCSAK
jgi:hypothetical protein